MSPSQVEWQWKTFSELSLHNLYQVLRLRQQVFVVEQMCCYEDIDNLDQQAVHLLGFTDQRQLIAYSRVFAPGTRLPEASIGRVLTAEHARRYGLGHEMVRRTTSYCQTHYPNSAICIKAQAHLKNFYATHGYVARGQEYLIDRIPHIDMCCQPN